MQLSFRWQAVAAALILGGYWALFVLFPGPDGAFSPAHNIGAVIDLAVLGRNYPGNYVTINFISSTVTTLFGVWTGYLMASNRGLNEKIRVLAGAAAACFALGLALSLFVPIVKRIWTPSFTIYSTGWVLVMLIAFVWLIEKQGYRKFAYPMLVVGANSIFAYVCFQLFRRSISDAIGVVTGRFEWLGTMAPVALATSTIAVIWYFCYWLYKRNIFIKV
jgi:predicted acyltransferase